VGIVEARESGKGIGIYDKDGGIHERADVDTIASALNSRLSRLIWEAPLKNQQEYFILRFIDVSLGNIQPRDALCRSLFASACASRPCSLSRRANGARRSGVRAPTWPSASRGMARRQVPEA
jgi:hypothetical protein